MSVLRIGGGTTTVMPSVTSLGLTGVRLITTVGVDPVGANTATLLLAPADASTPPVAACGATPEPNVDTPF